MGLRYTLRLGKDWSLPWIKIIDLMKCHLKLRIKHWKKKFPASIRMRKWMWTFNKIRWKFKSKALNWRGPRGMFYIEKYNLLRRHRHFFGLYYFRSVLISLHSFTLSSVYPLFSREVRFESIIPLFTPPLALKFTETRSQFFTRALKLYLLHPHYLLTTSSATLFHDLLYPRGILLLLRRAPITLLPMAFPLAVPSARYTLSLENDRTNSFSFLRICHPI